MVETRTGWQLLMKNNKVLLGTFLVLILGIPSTTLVIGWRIKAQSPTSDKQYNRAVTVNEPSVIPNKLLNRETSSLSTPSAQIALGPSLELKVELEGRPEGKQATKLFVGLALGDLKNNPSYLFSYNLDLPDSGEYKELSLAALTLGNTYTAYLKGQAQIATASAFRVGPNTTKLNLGDKLTLLTGDLNDDNVIDNADYNIVKAALGSTPKSKNWNQNIDFNLDNLINLLDLAIVKKNLGKIGASGAWYSKVATKSAEVMKESLVGSPSADILEEIKGNPNILPSESGFWIWVPKLP